MNLEAGDLITLDDKDEYIVMDNIKYQDNNYVFLMTKTKPISIKVAKEEKKEDNIYLNLVTDKDLLQELVTYITTKK